MRWTGTLLALLAVLCFVGCGKKEPAASAAAKDAKPAAVAEGAKKTEEKTPDAGTEETQAPAKKAKIDVGSAAPAIELTGADDKGFSLEALKGKSGAVLVFFALWCKACMEEVPDLVEFQKNYGEKGAPVVAVNFRDEPSKVKRFVKRKGVNYTVLLDPLGDVSGVYDVKGFPAIIGVNKDGTVVYRGSALPKDIEKFVRDLNRSDAPAVEGAEEGDIAFDFTLDTIDGKQVSLSEFKGKNVVIDFFASWNKKCSEGTKRVMQLKEADPLADIVVLSVNVEESKEKAEAYAKELGVSHPVLLDLDGRVKSLFELKLIPSYVVIDKQGVIRYKNITAPADFDELGKLISN